MKICAIYNAWSDCLDLLEKSIANTTPVVDGVIVVWSNTSNRGAVVPFRLNAENSLITLLNVEPNPRQSPQQNETMKRNAGIEEARRQGYTHFLLMDCDEFYVQEDIRKEKERIEREDLNGTVCALRVYIKEPTLWCEDNTLVPFIHKLTDGIFAGAFKNYPFAYERGIARIDPTRRLSCRTKVGWSEVVMHHFSYVRQDINLKIDNSTADLKRSREIIYRELQNAKEGYVSELYHRPLKRCEDIFKIKGPEQITQNCPAPG